MNLNKKIICIITCLILILTTFSGCLNKSESFEDSDLINNLPPTAKIIAPNKAYFGEDIEFDASTSYDSDGKIISYLWDFGDGEIIEGIKVNHSYKFDNDFFIKYPLIFPVTLFIEDNKGTLIATTYQIRIYPKEYKFYLSNNGLIAEKPLFFKKKTNSFIYELENPIILEKCVWNANLYLEKPLILTIKKITLTFYDQNANEITKKEKKLGFSIFWKEKIIRINGVINKDSEFKFLKIEIKSFLIIPKINIIYGGEKASWIIFDFSN